MRAGSPADRDQARRVRRYYEANTRWMLRRGVGRAEAVMHRPVWVDGVSTRREALRAVERLIADALALQPLPWPPPLDAPPHHILDLGCGVGSSALWLAERFSLSTTGITLSPLQAKAAAAQARRGGLENRCRFLVGDFTSPSALRTRAVSPGPPARGAYAIEAFVHSASPEGFFRTAAGLLASGGRLVICDDFLAEPAPEAPQRPPAAPVSPDPPRIHRRRARCLERFRRGWQLGSLISRAQLETQAAAAGFRLESWRDLTPCLRLEPRAWQLPQLALGLALAGTPWGASRLGGAALQQALRAGWVRYLFLVLERR